MKLNCEKPFARDEPCVYMCIQDQLCSIETSGRDWLQNLYTPDLYYLFLFYSPLPHMNQLAGCSCYREINKDEDVTAGVNRSYLLIMHHGRQNIQNDIFVGTYLKKTGNQQSSNANNRGWLFWCIKKLS